MKRYDYKTKMPTLPKRCVKWAAHVKLHDGNLGEGNARRGHPACFETSCGSPTSFASSFCCELLLLRSGTPTSFAKWDSDLDSDFFCELRNQVLFAL